MRALAGKQLKAPCTTTKIQRLQIMKIGPFMVLFISDDVHGVDAHGKGVLAMTSNYSSYGFENKSKLNKASTTNDDPSYITCSGSDFMVFA